MTSGGKDGGGVDVCGISHFLTAHGQHREVLIRVLNLCHGDGRDRGGLGKQLEVHHRTDGEDVLPLGPGPLVDQRREADLSTFSVHVDVGLDKVIDLRERVHDIDLLVVRSHVSGAVQDQDLTSGFDNIGRDGDGAHCK